jgi:UDP-N-acetylglucosamine--N-acetylmuramyl-(pentapeptide) pyrophosphoryl-undecaprenol N-acetylglucosamine transferase
MPRALGRGNGGKVRLVVTGGSQGARAINRAVAKALPRLRDIPGLEITHQTGAPDLDETRAAYAAAGVAADVSAFIDDLPARFARAHLVVSRAGGTVAELCHVGVGSILIPLPSAADDHQLANARELERAGAAVVVQQDAELETRLEGELVSLLQDGERRTRMGEAALARAKPHAAEEIWQHCRALLGRNGGAR